MRDPNVAIRSCILAGRWVVAVLYVTLAQGLSYDGTTTGISLRRIPGRPILIMGGDSEDVLIQPARFHDQNVEPSKLAYQQYLVRVRRAARKMVLNQLSTISEFVQYIPHDTFLVVASQKKLEGLERLNGVLGIFLSPDIMKTPADLRLWSPESKQNLRRSDSAIVSMNIVVAMDVTVDLLSTICEVLGKSISGCIIRKVSKRKFVAEIPQEHAAQLVSTAIEHPLVIWVEKQPQVKVRNKFAAGLVQGSDWQNGTSRTVWDHGLRGEGEIIGISDTGLDYKSCYFRDDTVPLPTCKGTGVVKTKGCVNQTHRKIVTYRYFKGTDVKDAYEGHGTHVCGSAVGNLLGSTNLNLASGFNGMAPNAKVAFDDLAVGEDLSVPEDLNELLFPHSYAAGARISSMSWGSEYAGYDTEAMEIDQFVHDHPDFVVLVAGGNSGPGELTIGAPATAKNILAVGASQHSYAALLALQTGTVLAVGVVSGPAGSAGRKFAAEGAVFGPVVAGSGKVWRGPVVQAFPRDACSSLSAPALNVSSVNGSIALIERGQCDFLLKVRNAEKAGAIAVIVTNDVESPAIVPMGGDVYSDVSIPSVMISLEDGNALRSYMASGTVIVQLPDYLVVEVEDASNLLTDFSSWGPTLDMRMKPDVVCPGDYIVSSRSHGSAAFNKSRDCEALLVMSGTSMATPICAGVAALVRQYFRLGFYPSGVETKGDGKNASAALVKAMMIHSGQPVKTWSEAAGWAFPTSMPDLSQGYGRVDITRVLKFKDEGNFDLKVWEASAADGGHTDTCIVVGSSSVPLRVSVVWTDPPAHPSSTRILVNDLDLVVIDPAGRFLYGNARTESDETHAAHAAVDTTNNAEQVTVYQPVAGGSYTVRVQGSDVPLSPQAYAVVVTGALSAGAGASCAAASLCPLNCSGHGTCKAGRCECDLAFSGTDCGLSNPVLACNQSQKLSVTQLGWSYYLLGLPSAAWGWELSLDWEDGDYPGYFVAFDRIPSEEDCDFCLNTLAESDLSDYGYGYGYYYYYDWNVSNSSIGNASSQTMICDLECATRFSEGRARGVWVLASTAYTDPSALAIVKLTCFALPHYNSSGGGEVKRGVSIAPLTTIAVPSPVPSPAEPGLQIQVSTQTMPVPSPAEPVVQIRVSTQFTMEQFNSTVRQLFRRALAVAAGVREEQIYLSVQGEARRVGQRLVLANSSSLSLVVVDAAVRGLAGADGATLVANRLSADSINAQMQASGLPAVQITRAAQVVLAVETTTTQQLTLETVTSESRQSGGTSVPLTSTNLRVSSQGLISLPPLLMTSLATSLVFLGLVLLY